MIEIIIGLVIALLVGGCIGFLCSIVVLLKMRAFEMGEYLEIVKEANEITIECLEKMEELENDVR